MSLLPPHLQTPSKRKTVGTICLTAADVQLFLDPDNQRSSRVFRISLKATKATSHLPIQLPLETLRIGRVKSPKGLAISPSGEWLVAIGGPKAYVCPLSSLDTGFTKFISDEPLTSLAFHPTQEYFATGDHKGRIRLWYCLDSSLIALGKGSAKDEDKRAQTTTLHWHAHAVSSLAFSSNGAYLLSGGEEAVLVIWQLHTGKKEFVPRVGSPIVSVAVMSHQNVEEEYLLVLSDGTLVMIGANSLRISKSFARIKHGVLLPNCCYSFQWPIFLFHIRFYVMGIWSCTIGSTPSHINHHPTVISSLLFTCVFTIHFHRHSRTGDLSNESSFEKRRYADHSVPRRARCYKS